MLLFITNAYSSSYSLVTRFGNTVFKDMMDPMNFPLLKNRKRAERSKRICYIILIVLAVLVSLSFMSFHPFWGINENSSYIYVMKTEDFKVFVEIFVFLMMILMTQSIMFVVIAAYYVYWSTHLLHFRITEDIKTHLSKKYENFNIISCKSEQDRISQHLIRIAKYHSRLKK